MAAALRARTEHGTPIRGMVEPFAPLAAPPRLRAPFIRTNAGSSGRLRPKMPVSLTRAASWRSYQAPATVRAWRHASTISLPALCAKVRHDRRGQPRVGGDGHLVDSAAGPPHSVDVIRDGLLGPAWRPGGLCVAFHSRSPLTKLIVCPVRALCSSLAIAVPSRVARAERIPVPHRCPYSSRLPSRSTSSEAQYDSSSSGEGRFFWLGPHGLSTAATAQALRDHLRPSSGFLGAAHTVCTISEVGLSTRATTAV